MQTIEVTSPELEQQFIDIAQRIQGANPQWISPLHKDIRDVFDPAKNKCFRFGTAIRWILLDDNQQPIGRIAAFTNSKYRNKGDDIPVGGVGFFECIDHQDAANLLLDTAKAWLAERGMQAMDGPINFGERDRWWGLVVEGFDPPMYCMNYNPPYYQHLFEQYGFQAFYHQICFGIDPKRPIAAKVEERHQQHQKDPDMRAETVSKKELDKYAADFVTVYNKAWAGHGGMKELTVDMARVMFRKMKPVMDERIIWYVYYKNEPIAIFINLPDLNQWFKHLKGGFSWYHKLKFLWVKATCPNKKAAGIVFGVVPEWQGKGVDAFMIGEAYHRFFNTSQSPYEKYEMQWIGDFNPRMLNVAENLGETTRSRILTTYRYLFDRSRPFERHPVV